MRYATITARVLLGLLFFVFGLNGFLNFMPPPPNLPAGVLDFMNAMIKTGFLFQLVAATELAAGALLLLNRFVPLALVLLAPLLVNILLFHIYLQPAGIVPGVIATLLEAWLVRAYWSAFAPLLRAKN